MRKKDPASTRNYVIKKTDGYIVVVEGEDDKHLDESDPNDQKIISQLEVYLQARKDAGLKISELFIKSLGLSSSASFATHTTGAGDYEPTQKRKKKKK
jgi:hypothetical protein